MASTINASTTLGLISSADTSGVLQLQTANTAAVTIDASQNVGVGTASPDAKLTVSQTSTPADLITLKGANSVTGALGIHALGNGGVYLQASSTRDIRLRIGSTDYATLDSAGNLGLGVTPSAWSSIKALQVVNASFGGLGNGNYSASNAYYDGANWKYIASNYATLYQQSGNAGDGTHKWFTAPSGTAGNAISFTQAMTLDASGRLMIGATSILGGTNAVSFTNTVSAKSVLAIQNTSTSGYSSVEVYNSSGSQTGAMGYGNASVAVTGAQDNVYLYSASAITFLSGGTSERMRIDSSGNLLVGTTTALYGARVTSSATGYSAASLITNTTSEYSLVALNQGTSGNNGFVLFQTESSPVTRGSITYNRAGGLVTYNTTSDYRAKDIFGPIVDSGALIDSVPVYMGKMKGATQERPMFIAHETPEYAHTGEKDAVDADGNPVYQQMDASSLIPVMWAEIQSLRQRLAVLEGK